jgi:muramoyltetrapeptide carboxypeptidase
MTLKRRELLRALAVVPALTGLGIAAAGATVRDGAIVRPRRLRPGMTVGLVSPASNVSDDESIRAALEWVESLGFRVKPGAHLFARTQYLAGSDRDRADDLNAMFADPGVDAIVCLRGGYGCSRLLPLLDYGTIAAHPKVLLGYSDISALLNAIHLRTGLITFHGPMAAENLTDYSYGAFRDTLLAPRAPQALAAPPPFASAPGRVERDNRITSIAAGTAEGRLVGGNLSLVCHLLGTPFEPDFTGRILFLEDVEEAPYSIDRLLTQLWLAGKLQQVAGIAFGKFTETAQDNTFSVEQVLRQRCGDLGIPVLRGLMIGHVEQQAVLPIGARARLDADAGTLTLLETAVS